MKTTFLCMFSSCQALVQIPVIESILIKAVQFLVGYLVGYLVGCYQECFIRFNTEYML